MWYILQSEQKSQDSTPTYLAQQYIEVENVSILVEKSEIPVCEDGRSTQQTGVHWGWWPIKTHSEHCREEE